MKIALLGAGKMGKILARLAEENGDEVVLMAGSQERAELTHEQLRQADVVIEFTRPESAFDNIVFCLEAGVPVVCGTTGWLHRLDEAIALCADKGGALFHAANFSIGVNLFFCLNKVLAEMMEQQPQYEVRLDETHHVHKLDAPSGTGLALARDILDRLSRKTDWVNSAEASPQQLPIISHRVGEAPGTHEITYSSAVDTITIRHEAHSREGFARGALQAARWLVGKQGYFEMEDMLQLKY